MFSLAIIGFRGYNFFKALYGGMIMSDEYGIGIEDVEAEVVEEGQKAFTIDDAPIAPEAPKPNFTGAESAGPSGSGSPKRVYGIISIICGILSVVCCCACWLPIIFGIAAVVFGVLSLRDEPEAKTLAIIGIVCGSIGGVIGIISVVMGGIFSAIGESLDNSIINPDIFDDLKDIGNL